MRLTSITITLALVAVLPARALAEPADKAFGLGLGVGVVTGPNLQLMTSMHSHLDLAMGVQFDDRLRVQADHAWRLASFASSASLHMPFYLGVGGFMSDRQGGAVDLGVRMPVGVQADFARAPIQLFGELSPELVLVQGVDRYMPPPPPPGLALTGLMGVRAAF